MATPRQESVCCFAWSMFLSSRRSDDTQLGFAETYYQHTTLMSELFWGVSLYKYKYTFNTVAAVRPSEGTGSMQATVTGQMSGIVSSGLISFMSCFVCQAWQTLCWSSGKNVGSSKSAGGVIPKFG